MDFSLLDSITTSDGTVYHGIIDFSTTKHITFFDVRKIDSPQIREIVIYWRVYYTHMRFSIFLATFFSQDKFHPILINKRDIVEILSGELIPKKPKVKKEKINKTDS